MPSNNDESRSAGDHETEYSVFETDETDDGRDVAGRDDERGAERRDAERDPTPGGLESSHEHGCPKCGGTETETDKIATSGTGLTKLFDVQNRRFIVVSCADCGYSELYKGQSANNAIDFFIG